MMLPPGKTHVIVIRLGLGTVVAVLLVALLWLIAAREPGRMAAATTSIDGRAIENGAATYAAACAGRHGVAGQGVPDVAPALNSPPFFTERLAELNYQGDLRSYIEATVSAGRPVRNDTVQRRHARLGSGLRRRAAYR